MSSRRGGAGPPTRVSGIHAVASVLRDRPDRVRKLLLQKGAKAHPARDVLVREAEEAGVPVDVRDADWFSSLAPGRNTQGIAAELAPFPYATLADVLEKLDGHTAILLFLDGVTDPQNLGSLVRSAAFFGVDAIVIPKDRSVEVTPTVERISVGGATEVPICRVTNLVRAMKEAQQAGFWVYGTVVGSGRLLADTSLEGRVGIVLGAEGEGIRRLVRESCDHLVSLPSLGKLDSLNVAVFGALALFQTRSSQAGWASDNE